MDIKDRQNKLQGLEAIKRKALIMVDQGKDAFEIRDFIGSASKELAYQVPDEEAFNKAVKAAGKFKKSKKK